MEALADILNASLFFTSAFLVITCFVGKASAQADSAWIS
jgi:hypothetical protein